MGTKITLPFLLLFYSAIGLAQARKQIHGKITVEGASASKVLILNLNTEQEVGTSAEGFFTISVQTDDVLVFASPKLYYLQKTIESTDFFQNPMVIEMYPKPEILDEVEIVDFKKYNAVDLGILQQPAKRYTPAERRLYTAGDFKPIHLLGLLGGSL